MDSQIEQKEYKFTWESPYTKDLEHYQYALTYWKKIDPSYINPFPDNVFKNMGYKFFFAPSVMQGGSQFYLRIKFDNLKELNNYFETKSKHYQTEISSIEKCRYSTFCCPDNTIESYGLNPNTTIRILTKTKCSSQNINDVLGGYVIGIAKDTINRYILIWAINNN